MGHGNFKWDSAECTVFEIQEDNTYNFCEACKTSCQGAVSMVITNLITTALGIKGNLSRSTPQGDRNCGKTTSLIIGTTGTISTLIALSLYADVCGRNLPDQILTNSIDYQIGSGFICLLVATLLNAIDVLINLLTPVPNCSHRFQSTGESDSLKKPVPSSTNMIGLRTSLLDL